MARPKNKEKKVHYTIMVEPSIVEEIKTLAEKAEMPPGTLARNLLLLGLDNARLFNMAGIIGLVGASRRQIDKYKKQFNLEQLDTENGKEENLT